MKKVFFSLFLVASFTVNAQVKTPQPSPSSKLEQKVGLTDVTIEYSRPSVKGRTIFGDLVPYDKMWRTGANKNTMVTFSDDVSIGGKTLKKGTYALFTKPGKTSWEVYFYSDTNNWGTPKEWDDSKVALKTSVKAEQIPAKIESFTILVDDLKNDSAVLGLMWDATYAGIPFKVPTETTVEESITKVMNGPSAGDYYSAAVYYLDQGKDIAKAKEWIDKAVSLSKDKPKFWYLYRQASIHAKAGAKSTAKKAAKASMALAKKAGNDTYVKNNENLLKTL